ncbi:MAG: DNRLRE domain-containing protein [Actinobacteria bacterium]|nr:DNRLRE domain-containing protein [Actinomycetota bacterium]
MLFNESHEGAVISTRRDSSSLVRWLTIVLLVMLLGATLTAFMLVSSGEAVIGPEGIYTENNGDIIEICADAACTTHTNTFANGSIVYIRVTTTRVANRASGVPRLYNYQHGAIGTAGVWTQVSAVSPYVYTSAVTIPAANVNGLKLVGSIVSSTSARIQFEEAIDIPTVNRFIHFYSDAARTDESYTFRPGAVMYIKTYGNGNVVDAAQTSTTNRMYSFTNAQAAFWAAPAVTQAGNWYDFALTLPASGLIDGNWYWVRTLLRNSAGGTIERNSRMIQVDGSNPTTAITSPAAGAYVNGTVPVDGTATDTFSFYSYLLEYGAGASPSSWTAIGTTTYTPVTAGLLQNWDTTTVTDGLYTLRLTATDRAYNTSQATRQVNVDNNAPVISALQATSVTSSSASITWTTNEAADSQVEYGTSPGVYTYSTTLDPAMMTNHSVPLTGLQPSTTYYYRARSADAAGLVSYSLEQNLTTANLTVLQPFPAVGRDTYFGTAQPTWNRGAETTLSVGDMATPGLGTLRSAIRFDLSGIPSGATVLSARLSAYQMGQGNTNPQTLDLHYLTRDWVQGTGTGSATADGVTWNTYNGVSNWTTAGGDYNAGISGSVSAPNSTASWVDWDITALTQSWTNLSIANNGAIIKQSLENPAVSDAKTYYSSEFTTDASLRPKLTIEWFGTDVTPPAIGEVRADNITRTAANIRWSTDEQANSQVEYGTTTSYGSSTTVAPAMVNQHTVALPGLTEDTVFHYRVKSTDRAGNTTVSGDYVFQTARLVTIQPSPSQGEDTWIANAGATLNYGASTDLVVGNYNASSDNRRGLLRFDLSVIPVGSTVNAATMSLYQHAQEDASTPQLGVYYATRSWTEGTGSGTATADGATWNTYDGLSNWSSAGGDFNGTAQATAIAPDSTGAWLDFQITGLTQSWVSGSLANEGMFVKKSGENPAVRDFKTFYSSEYLGDPSLRPKLTVEYVPAPGSMTLTVSETYNRDASSGGGSVGFGNVSPGSNYDVGEGDPPPYAVKLQIKSNTMWGLKVAATGDLAQLNPANTIDIGDLKWKQDGEAPAAYQSIVKTPAETIIATGQDATDNYPFFFDYRLAVPTLAVSGNYSTAVVYTAYPSS